MIEKFQEKPPVMEGWVSGGFFVLHRQVLDLIEGDQMAFESEPLRQLADQKQLAVYQHHGFWQCMDTYRELEVLNKLYNSDQAPWKVWK
jgi:glucose-1-phosphate cytidylyltransferase